MHTSEEYARLAHPVFRAALDICATVLRKTGNAEPRDVLLFCIRNGYLALPLSPTTFGPASWLKPQRGPGGPQSLEDARRAIAVCLCFHDDPTPACAEKEIGRHGSVVTSRLGYFPEEDRLVCLTNCDWLSPLEGALQLLHEMRHARQKLGPSFENRPPLDPPEISEMKTWEFQLCGILDVIGDTTWQTAVEREAAWLAAPPPAARASTRPTLLRNE